MFFYIQIYGAIHEFSKTQVKRSERVKENNFCLRIVIPNFVENALQNILFNIKPRLQTDDVSSMSRSWDTPLKLGYRNFAERESKLFSEDLSEKIKGENLAPTDCVLFRNE